MAQPLPAAASLRLLALDFPPARGGIQTLTQEIYGRLPDLLQIAVAPASPEPDTVAGFPLQRSRYPSRSGVHTLRYLADANRILARQPPGLTHCNHLFAGHAAWWNWRRHRTPYLVWVHGAELGNSRHHTLSRLSLAHASAILTNSAFTAQLIRTFLPASPPPIHIIPLGAGQPFLAPPATPAWRLPAQILTVSRLSRLDRYKGLDVALAALGRLRRQGFDFRYHIAGDGDDRAFLEQRARLEGIADKVEFLGRVDGPRLLELYDACDVFLLCSRDEQTQRGRVFEGFGIVFLEAAARAKPVVAGHSGGVPDAVVDGETGLLVDPTQPAAVADGLAQLLLSPELRQRLGRQGRRRVEQTYNWDEAAARVRDIHLRLWRSAEAP